MPTMSLGFELLSTVNEGDERTTLSQIVTQRDTCLSELEIWAVCREACLALTVLHNSTEMFQTVCISPETLAFDTNGGVCFLDLGIDPEPLYIPPEYEDIGNSYKAHLYSLGMTLFYAAEPEYMGDATHSPQERHPETQLSIMIANMTVEGYDERLDLPEVMRLCDEYLDGYTISSDSICQEMVSAALYDTSGDEDEFSEAGSLHTPQLQEMWLASNTAGGALWPAGHRSRTPSPRIHTISPRLPSPQLRSPSPRFLESWPASLNDSLLTPPPQYQSPGVDYHHGTPPEIFRNLSNHTPPHGKNNHVNDVDGTDDDDDDDDDASSRSLGTPPSADEEVDKISPTMQLLDKIQTNKENSVIETKERTDINDNAISEVVINDNAVKDNVIRAVDLENVLSEPVSKVNAVTEHENKSDGRSDMESNNVPHMYGLVKGMLGDKKRMLDEQSASVSTPLHHNKISKLPNFDLSEINAYNPDETLLQNENANTGATTKDKPSEKNQDIANDNKPIGLRTQNINQNLQNPTSNGQSLSPSECHNNSPAGERTESQPITEESNTTAGDAKVASKDTGEGALGRHASLHITGKAKHPGHLVHHTVTSDSTLSETTNTETCRQQDTRKTTTDINYHHEESHGTKSQGSVRSIPFSLTLNSTESLTYVTTLHGETGTSQATSRELSEPAFNAKGSGDINKLGNQPEPIKTSAQVELGSPTESEDIKSQNETKSEVRQNEQQTILWDKQNEDFPTSQKNLLNRSELSGVSCDQEDQPNKSVNRYAIDQFHTADSLAYGAAAEFGENNPQLRLNTIGADSNKYDNVNKQVDRTSTVGSITKTSLDKLQDNSSGDKSDSNKLRISPRDITNKRLSTSFGAKATDNSEVTSTQVLSDSDAGELRKLPEGEAEDSVKGQDVDAATAESETGSMNNQDTGLPKGQTVQEILEKLGALHENELWALCRECVLTLLRNKQQLPAYVSLDTVVISQEGHVTFCGVAEDSELEVIYLAPELQQYGVVTDKTCLFGVAAMLYSAAEFPLTTNQEPALSEDFENLLMSMVKDSTDDRPDITTVLKACNDYQSRQQMSSLQVCQTLWTDSHKATAFGKENMLVRDILNQEMAENSLLMRAKLMESIRQAATKLKPALERRLAPTPPNTSPHHKLMTTLKDLRPLNKVTPPEQLSIQEIYTRNPELLDSLHRVTSRHSKLPESDASAFQKVPLKSSPVMHSPKSSPSEVPKEFNSEATHFTPILVNPNEPKKIVRKPGRKLPHRPVTDKQKADDVARNIRELKKNLLRLRGSTTLVQDVERDAQQEDEKRVDTGTAEYQNLGTGIAKANPIVSESMRTAEIKPELRDPIITRPTQREVTQTATVLPEQRDIPGTTRLESPVTPHPRSAALSPNNHNDSGLEPGSNTTRSQFSDEARSLPSRGSDINQSQVINQNLQGTTPEQNPYMRTQSAGQNQYSPAIQTGSPSMPYLPIPSPGLSPAGQVPSPGIQPYGLPVSLHPGILPFQYHLQQDPRTGLFQIVPIAFSQNHMASPPVTHPTSPLTPMMGMPLQIPGSMMSNETPSFNSSQREDVSDRDYRRKSKHRDRDYRKDSHSHRHHRHCDSVDCELKPEDDPECRHKSVKSRDRCRHGHSISSSDTKRVVRAEPTRFPEESPRRIIRSDSARFPSEEDRLHRSNSFEDLRAQDEEQEALPRDTRPRYLKRELNKARLKRAKSGSCLDYSKTLSSDHQSFDIYDDTCACDHSKGQDHIDSRTKHLSKSQPSVHHLIQDEVSARHRRHRLHGNASPDLISSPSPDSGVCGLNLKGGGAAILMERLLNSDTIKHQQRLSKVINLLREEFAFDGYMENGEEDLPMAEFIISLGSLSSETFSSAIAEKFSDLYWQEELLSSLYEAINGSKHRPRSDNSGPESSKQNDSSSSASTHHSNHLRGNHLLNNQSSYSHEDNTHLEQSPGGSRSITRLHRLRNEGKVPSSPDSVHSEKADPLQTPKPRLERSKSLGEELSDSVSRISVRARNGSMDETTGFLYSLVDIDIEPDHHSSSMASAATTVIRQNNNTIVKSKSLEEEEEGNMGVHINPFAIESPIPDTLPSNDFTNWSRSVDNLPLCDSISTDNTLQDLVRSYDNLEDSMHSPAPSVHIPGISPLNNNKKPGIRNQEVIVQRPTGNGTPRTVNNGMLPRSISTSASVSTLNRPGANWARNHAGIRQIGTMAENTRSLRLDYSKSESNLVASTDTDVDYLPESLSYRDLRRPNLLIRRGEVAYYKADSELLQDRALKDFIMQQVGLSHQAIEMRISEGDQQLMMERRNRKKTLKYFGRLAEFTPRSSKSSEQKPMLYKVTQELEESKEKMCFLDSARKYLEMMYCEHWGLSGELLYALANCPGDRAMLLAPCDNPLLMWQSMSHHSAPLLHAGTAVGLASYLFSDTALSEGYVHQFFYTYRYFITSFDVFDFLSDKYSAAILSLSPTSQVPLKVMSRSLDLIYIWLDGYYGIDFKNNPELARRLDVFIHEKVSSSDSVGADLLYLLEECKEGTHVDLMLSGNTSYMRDGSDRRSAGHERQAPRKIHESSVLEAQWESFKAALHLSAKPVRMQKVARSSSVACVDRKSGIMACMERAPSVGANDAYYPRVIPRRSDTFTLADYMPQTLAEQLTLLEQELFQKSHPVQYLNSKAQGVGVALSNPVISKAQSLNMLNQAWEEHKGSNLFVGNHYHDDTIQCLIEHAHSISFWVAAEIISCPSAKSQVVLISKLLMTAHICQSMKNYATCLAILDGLENIFISQLQAWRSLPTKYTELRTELNALKLALHGDNGYVLRERDQSRGPAIPSILLFLLHVQQEEIGGFTLASGMHKWNKLRSISRLVDQIRILQQSMYDFESDLDLQKAIQQRIHDYGQQDLAALVAQQQNNRQKIPNRKMQGAFKRMRGRFKSNT